MSSTTTFLKNYIPTARSIITQPRKFYQNMPISGDFAEPLAFAILTTLIISLIYAPIILISLLGYLPQGSDLIFFFLGLAVLFLYNLISMLISIPINAIIYHALLLIFGAKGSLKATLQVFCYYLATSLVVLPVMSIILLIFYLAIGTGMEGIGFDLLPVAIIAGITAPVLYSFYVLFVGFSEVHHISMKRVIMAIFGIPTVLFILFMALMIGIVFIAEQSDSYGMPSQNGGYFNTHNQLRQDTINPQSNLTAPYKTPPILDGYYTPEDGWDEAHPIKFTSGRERNTECTIAAKHDGQMLYILLMWEGEPEWADSITLYFEQDENSHDHDRYTGMIDVKYNGATVYGPANFADAHNDEGVMESEDGAVYANYENGLWVQEWVIPLKNDEYGDIYINEYPTTLGFAIDSQEFSGPQWPPSNTHNIEPQYWGDLEILYSENMVNTTQPTTITASSGTTPIIDGDITPEDGWDETQQIHQISKNADFYTLAAKHDSKNLYIMVKWRGESGYSSSFIYFEQDGNTHDHNLTTGMADRKHNSASNNYMDEHWGNSEGEEENGMARSNYSNGYWVYEWLIPLRTGDEHDISVEQYPSNFGFMVEINNVGKNGFWPYDAAVECSPECWGDIEIVE